MVVLSVPVVPFPPFLPLVVVSAVRVEGRVRVRIRVVVPGVLEPVETFVSSVTPGCRSPTDGRGMDGRRRTSGGTCPPVAPWRNLSG